MKHVTPARFQRNDFSRLPGIIFDDREPQFADSAARKLALQFGLDLPHARLVVELAGMAKGGRHA
jgi:hypothetical protein